MLLTILKYLSLPGTINPSKNINRMIEIDFILNKSIALEVKTSGDNKDINKLKRLANQLNIDEYYLIMHNFLNDEKAIPAYQI